MSQGTQKLNRKRRRKAASALLLLLKRTRNVCGTFDSVEQWYGYVKKYVEPVLKEYKDAIPQELTDTIRQAENVTGTSRDAIHRTCKNLKKDLELGAKLLGKGSFVTGWLTTLIVAGILAAGIATYLNANAVTLTIHNNGCAPIRPSSYIALNIPGLSLPKDPIATGESATAKVPPITFSLSATDSSIRLSAYRLNLSFNLQSRDIDVVFDQKSLLSGSRTISLSPKSSHTVEAICR